MEAFSDGVFAIAATLLVLEFSVTSGHDLGHQLLQLISVADVVVERHRTGSQGGGQGPHAQSSQPVAVHDLQRGHLDLVDRETLADGWRLVALR